MNRREFLRLTTQVGTGMALSGLAAGRLRAQTNPTGPGAIRFAVIGDYGETLADQTFPLDQVGAMIRSWNPDFVVSLGDNNYVLGQASTIDVNIGKNFTEFIYPKTTQIPVDYPYPSGAPLYNRFIPCLGNHDYADVADDALPEPSNIALSQPYLDYFRNAVRTGAAPNTTFQFADNAVGQTWTQALISGDVEDYQPFSESENIRFFDVRLGTATGPSSVHLFVFDSDSATPYSRYAADRQIPNRDGSPSAFTEIATQGHWLQQRLAASTAQWKIVLFHHPPYNSAPGAENSQYTFMRWPFQAWGATAVLSGHVHNYERLEMPDSDANFQPIPGGPTIPYFVNGAGGFIPEQGFDPSFVVSGSKVRVAEYGAQLITADENSINFLYFDIDGVLRDVHTLYADNSMGVPQVEFDGREFPVDASAGTVMVPVRRLGDTSQPLSVNYATMDGTAVAGVNYVATSGPLNFGAGESEKTIPVTINPPPIFGPDTTPWESLIFSIGLSSPTGGSLGFFSVGVVIMVNTVDTPITNQDLFIVQSYRDLFQVDPTPSEIDAARAAIGVLDLWIYRAKWIYDLLTANTATEPVFKAVQVYAMVILSDAGVVAGYAVPPSFPDLVNGVTLWRSAATTDDALVALSEAFNANLLEYLDAKFPGFDTDSQIFILAIYTVLIDPPTQADINYWTARLSDGPDAARTRNLMLGRMATESFDPPPEVGMTSFNLVADNANEVLLGIIIAGLLRIQLTYKQFATGYLIPARIGGGVVITDDIYNIIQSADYAARFRVTSYDGFIDSVKGSLPEQDRLPEADPEGEGNSNLREYSFALQPGAWETLTELEVEEDGGQRFAIFTYRQARNVKRVEFLIQTSTDCVHWTIVANIIPDGGTDMGTYVRRRIKIPVSLSDERRFFRVKLRQIP